MKRELIKAVMDEAKTIEKALEGLPYRDAVPSLRALEEIRACVSEELPGHEYAECAWCEEAKGVEEVDWGGEERICHDCLASAKQPAQ